METLRTPDERFENLPGYDFKPNYVDVHGLRMHYVDEGQGDPVLCLHGEPSWSYLYRKMIPRLSKGNRVIAPDLIGFGKSDKLVHRADYTFAMHYSSLIAFIEAIDLQRATLVCQDWGGLLGLPLAMDHGDRFARIVIMNTGLPQGESLGPGFMAWRNAAEKMDDMPVGMVIQGATVSDLPDDVVAAYDAPFPDKSYKAGAHEFPMLVPITPDDPATPHMKRALEALMKWDKPALVMFSDSDPVTAGADKFMRHVIPTAKAEPEIVIEKGGHFLQEDKGEEIADHINAFIARRPIA